jgi:hypothetical protein
MKHHLLATTAVQPPLRQVLGGPANPQRLLTTPRGTFFVGRVPNHLSLARYVAVRRAMALAAYAGGIRPHGAPADAIEWGDADVVDRPDVYPPEYRRLMGQIASEAGNPA